jgi:hypothetical protein
MAAHQIKISNQLEILQICSLCRFQGIVGWEEWEEWDGAVGWFIGMMNHFFVVGVAEGAWGGWMQVKSGLDGVSLYRG